MEEFCGKCKHHKAVITIGKDSLDWICDNEDSDNYTDYTSYEDSCEDFEER
ncbi:MAG: hypothetical protein J6S67_20510 [Methanobrevibacter sp.]|nr:hypothetical protein [Methanobrevibacter sp.]